MKNLYLISIFFFAISLVFSSDSNSVLNNNTDKGSLLSSTENSQVSISKNVSSPIDIERMKESRLAKGRVEKIKSQQILNRQKNGVLDKNQNSNPNIELIGKEFKIKQMLSQKMGADMFEKYSRKIEKKYVMRSISDNESGNKIKFPVETESK